MAKIKPNEPCPCGSGKKYKKCCSGKTSQIRSQLSGTASISFNHDIASSILEIRDIKILITGEIDSFCEGFDVKITDLKNRMGKACEIVDSINLFYSGIPNIIFTYSDEMARNIISDQSEFEDVLALQMLTTPLNISGFEFENYILLLPSQIKKAMELYPEEIRRDAAIHTLIHEFTHAIGVSPGPGAKVNEELYKIYDLIADSVSFQVNFNERVSDNFYLIFNYLNLHRPEGTNGSNDLCANMANSILSQTKNETGKLLT